MRAEPGQIPARPVGCVGSHAAGLVRPAAPAQRSFRSPCSTLLKYLEPALKIILPPIAVSIELYWDHEDYRCARGGARRDGAGRSLREAQGEGNVLREKRGPFSPLPSWAAGARRHAQLVDGWWAMGQRAVGHRRRGEGRGGEA